MTTLRLHSIVTLSLWLDLQCNEFTSWIAQFLRPIGMTLLAAALVAGCATAVSPDKPQRLGSHPTPIALEPKSPPKVPSRWSQSVPRNAHLKAAAIDREGDVVWAPTLTAGHVIGQTQVARGLSLIKTNSVGQIVWARQLSNAHEAFALDLVVTGSGRYVMSGSFASTIFSGIHQLKSAGDRDAFIAVFSSKGDLQWTRSLGGLARESALRVAVTEDETLFSIAGFSESSFRFSGSSFPARGTASDGFIATYSETGVELWATRIRGVGADRVSDIVYEDQELIAMGTFSTRVDLGEFKVVSEGGADIFCIRYDRLGKAIWLRSWGSKATDDAIALGVASTGTIYLLGHPRGDLAINDTIQAARDGNGLIWTLTPYGETLASQLLETKKQVPIDLEIYDSIHVTTQRGNATSTFELDNNLRTTRIERFDITPNRRQTTISAILLVGKGSDGSPMLLYVPSST